MQMIQPDENENDNHSQTKWQIYQPSDQNQPVFKAFNKQLKNLFKFTIILSVTYLVLALLSPLTILVLVLLIAATVKLITLKLTQIRKQGLVYSLSPKLKQLLLEKSIFDIYCDLLYFPLITKIIAAFFKPLLAKPHPSQLHQTFQSLPQNVQFAIARKGLLSLAPEKVQDLFVDSQKYVLPETFGVETWQWKNHQLYQNHHDKVHQDTLIKRVALKIDNKVSWTGFLAMTAIVGLGVYRNPSKFKSLLIQNGIFAGFILVILVTVIKIKKLSEFKRKAEQKRKMESLRFAILDKDD